MTEKEHLTASRDQVEIHVASLTYVLDTLTALRTLTYYVGLDRVESRLLDCISRLKGIQSFWQKRLLFAPIEDEKEK